MKTGRAQDGRHLGEGADRYRRAVARGRVRIARRDARSSIVERRNAQRRRLYGRQVAGIMAAKRTAETIPMCHPVPLTGIDSICGRTMIHRPWRSRPRCEPKPRRAWRWRRSRRSRPRRSPCTTCVNRRKGNADREVRPHLQDGGNAGRLRVVETRGDQIAAKNG